MSNSTATSTSGWCYLAAATVLGIGAVTLAMFLPLLAIGLYLITPEQAGAAPENLETGVGIGVIMRATARRLFRSGVQNTLRTSLGAFTRTAARTATRRITRIALRQVTAITFATLIRDAHQGARQYTFRESAYSLALGYVGLFLSFRCILAIVGAERASAVCGGISPTVAALIAAAPLLLHGVITWMAGRNFGVQATFHTQIDGLLLQGYFVGAGSFLPLTTDTEYRGGDASARAKTAASALLGLVAIHLGLNLMGRELGYYPLQFAGASVLMYAFVFAFPLPPLEGNHLWRFSKWLWVAIWLPTLIAFLANIPDAFAEIL